LKIRHASILLALLSVIAVPTRARAVDLHNVLTGYGLASWTEGEGRSLGGVAAIAQDLSGYLWLGTSAGLVRFDGWRFARWETIGRGVLPRSPVNSLYVARDGVLWVGFADGAVRRIKGLDVVDMTTSPDASEGPVVRLTEDGSGAMWTVIGTTVHRFREGRWEQVLLTKGSPEPAAVMVRAIGSEVWIGSRYGLYKWIAESDTFQKVLDLGALDAAKDANGHLWITDFSSGFRAATSVPRAGELRGKGLRLLTDRRGNLWVATIGEGLWRVQLSDGGPALEKASVNTGLLSDSIQALIEDREGNIWIGTPGGLQRLTERTLTPVANIGLVTALHADATTVWAGTNNGLYRLLSGSDRWVREPKQPTDLWVRSVHTDRGGTVWVGSDRTLLKMRADRLEPVALPSDFTFGPIDSLTSDRAGTIFFSDGPHLFRWQHGRLERVDADIRIGGRQIVKLYADSSDRLWIVFKDGSLGVLDAATLLPREIGKTRTAPQAVYDVFEDAAHVTWLVGNSSLTKVWGERFVTLADEQRLPPSIHGALVSDGRDELWLNTDGGLLRLSQEAFEAAIDDPGRQLRYQLYDAADGVAGPSTVKLLAQRDANGRLWFARGGALTTVTPARLAAPIRPIPNFVRIESVVTDDGVQDLDRHALAPRTRRIEINYTALALTAPNKIRFRYRLDGFDADWIDAGTRRQAFYTNLAPGAYVFRVEAGANGGHWSDSSAAWEFRREPAFFQTRGFYLGSVLLLGLLAAGVWKFRVNMMHREFAAVLAERMRLSRELHDTLLQHLVGLALQLDSLADSLGAQAIEGRQRLVRIRKQVEGYVREARQSVYELRGSSPPSPDLAASLTEFGAKRADGMITFESHVEGQPSDYSARLRRAVIRIGQEAITNAVRHADATTLRLDLRFETGAIALRVVDDGCGFDVDRIDSGTHDHYGLISMRERAEDVGAQLEISSERGRGTVVQLVAPLLDD
jgi:signal transduction histidine kinase/ligand-binding sensor domain-containing protein